VCQIVVLTPHERSLTQNTKQYGEHQKFVWASIHENISLSTPYEALTKTYCFSTIKSTLSSLRLLLSLQRFGLGARIIEVWKTPLGLKSSLERIAETVLDTFLFLTPFYS